MVPIKLAKQKSTIVAYDLFVIMFFINTPSAHLISWSVLGSHLLARTSTSTSACLHPNTCRSPSRVRIQSFRIYYRQIQINAWQKGQNTATTACDVVYGVHFHRVSSHFLRTTEHWWVDWCWLTPPTSATVCNSLRISHKCMLCGWFAGAGKKSQLQCKPSHPPLYRHKLILAIESPNPGRQRH